MGHDHYEFHQMSSQSRPPTGGYSLTPRLCRTTNFRTLCHKDLLVRGLRLLVNTIMDHNSHGARLTEFPPLKVSPIAPVDY